MLAGHSDDNNGNIDKINIIQTDKNEAVTSLRGISRDTGSLSTSITENIIATTKMPTINSHQDINLGLGTLWIISPSLITYLIAQLLIDCSLTHSLTQIQFY